MASDSSGKRWGSVLRNSWQKMNDWGDEFERRHFDGDLLGTITEGPKKVGQAMNNWGDEFERRHFDGDCVGTVTAGPKQVGQAMSDWGDDFERRHFDGDFAGSMARGAQVATELLAEAVVDGADGLASEGFGGGSLDISSSSNLAAGYALSNQTSLEGSVALEPKQVASHVAGCEREAVAAETPFGMNEDGASSSSTQPDARDAASIAPAARAADEFTDLLAIIDILSKQDSLDAAADLRDRLKNEKCKRQDRAEALRALAVDIRELPNQIAEERRLLDAVAGDRASAAARSMAASRALHALKSNHQSLQERHEAQMEEREQLEAAADAALAASTRAERLTSASSPSREWARDGPETDALKEAKMTLALLLTQVDEARLARRKELAGLNKDMEVLERENQVLRRGGYEAPAGSFRESLRRLFRVAAGREDGCEHPERTAG